MPSPFDTVIHWLSKSENILVIIHRNPDGDAIASSLALVSALKSIGKHAVVVGKDPIPTPFLFLPGTETIHKDYLQGDWDTMVVLDCGDLKRTGFPERIAEFAKNKKRLINIDHHPKNDLHKIANITLFDEKVAAVGEIVTKIIDNLKIELDKNIATCLLTSLYTDTGGFKHANTSSQTLGLAARFMAAGARLNTITKYISNPKSISGLRTWGFVLSQTVYHSQTGLVTAVVTQSDLEKVAGTADELSGAINIIGNIPQAKGSLLLIELPDDQLKVCLRARNAEINILKLARFFEGGGHKKASGFTIPGKIFNKSGKWSIAAA